MKLNRHHFNVKGKRAFRTFSVKTLPLFLSLFLLLTGCSLERTKPVLTPEIRTSAPNATNLREYTIPEGMARLKNLDALKNARAQGDTDMEGIPEIYLLSEAPEGMTPTFHVKEGGIMIIYKDPLNEERTLLISQTHSQDPEKQLKALGEPLRAEMINGKTFHFAGISDSEEHLVAYTIRDEWLIRLEAFGWNRDEFRSDLTHLIREPLD